MCVTSESSIMGAFLFGVFLYWRLQYLGSVVHAVHTRTSKIKTKNERLLISTQFPCFFFFPQKKYKYS